MIQHPVLLFVVLGGLALAVQHAAVFPKLQPIFAVTPVPFWCYVIPMIGTAAGLWPADAPVYGWLSRQLLPVCLGLCILGADLRAISRLGRQALILMLAGSSGIIAGMVVASLLWKTHLPDGAWQGLGALAASWTGGSMNLLAVKEALGMPDSMLGSLVIVDTIVAYGWMACLLLPIQRRDRQVPAGPTQEAPRANWFAGVAVAVGLSLISQRLAGILPTSPSITTATWTVLLVTTGAILLSLTPARQLGQDPRLSRIGMSCLLILLTSIGARASLQGFLHAPWFLVAGITAVMVHAGMLWMVGRLIRGSFGLIATVSQANIGGVVSAPLVAAAYDRHLIPVGLLLAVLGNIVGTYCGLLTAYLCRTITS